MAIWPRLPDTAEMKRLYVLPEAQGTGLGRRLADAIVTAARQAGYQHMVLDTLERLRPGLSLYRSMGFECCTHYYENPLPGVVYLQRAL